MYADNLQDPPGAEWSAGGNAQTTPHILVILAADRESDLKAEVARLITERPAPREAVGYRPCPDRLKRGRPCRRR
jgi:hypothetical protein